jgi:hypothetical protein
MLKRPLHPRLSQNCSQQPGNGEGSETPWNTVSLEKEGSPAIVTTWKHRGTLCGVNEARLVETGPHVRNHCSHRT